MAQPAAESEAIAVDAVLAPHDGTATNSAPDDFIDGPAFRLPATAYDPDTLVVDLGTFEGPLDLLLRLAREQKVDLAQISILKLADQYLAYIHNAKKLELDVAADYLVMAAWLAYLKSRLLLPRPQKEEPDAAHVAALLAFQLQRLEAMQQAGLRLFKLPQLGKNFYLRGDAYRAAMRAANQNQQAPVSWDVSLYELLSAMAEPLKRNEQQKVYHIKEISLFSLEAAYLRLQNLLGVMPDWSALQSFMPLVEEAADNLTRRSAMAAAFVASLEMAKQGMVELRQEQRYGNIYLRRKEHVVPNVIEEEVA